MDMIFEEEFFDSLDLSTPIVMTVDDGSLLTTKHECVFEDFVNIDSVQRDLDSENARLEKLREQEDLMAITYTTIDTKARPDIRMNKTPTTIMICDTIGMKTSRVLMRVLFDSGSGKTLLRRSKVPKGAQLIKLNKPQVLSTVEGKVPISEMVYMRDIRLPELEKNRSIEGSKVFIFDKECRYDVFMGGVLLERAGIDLLYSKEIVDWLGNTIEMRDVRNFHPSDLDAMMEAYYLQEEEELLGDDFLDAFATPILDAKYEQVDVDDVADNQKHLTPTQREELKAVFRKYRKLFDGTLGVYVPSQEVSH